jgi:hypothetical protein
MTAVMILNFAASLDLSNSSKHTQSNKYEAMKYTKFQEMLVCFKKCWAAGLHKKKERKKEKRKGGKKKEETRRNRHREEEEKITRKEKKGWSVHIGMSN